VRRITVKGTFIISMGARQFNARPLREMMNVPFTRYRK